MPPIVYKIRKCYYETFADDVIDGAVSEEMKDTLAEDGAVSGG